SVANDVPGGIDPSFRMPINDAPSGLTYKQAIQKATEISQEYWKEVRRIRDTNDFPERPAELSKSQLAERQLYEALNREPKFGDEIPTPEERQKVQNAARILSDPSPSITKAERDAARNYLNNKPRGRMGDRPFEEW